MKPIHELIDIQIWDSITVMTIKKKLKLDTVKYTSNNEPPIIVNNGIVSNFDEHVRKMLRIRKKEIEALGNQKTVSDEKEIFIYENQGFTHAGYTIYFYVVFGSNMDNVYTFSYNQDTDSFSVQKESYAMEDIMYPYFYSGMEFGILTGIDVITKITRKDKNQLSYEIVRIIAK